MLDVLYVKVREKQLANLYRDSKIVAIFYLRYEKRYPHFDLKKQTVESVYEVLIDIPCV